MYEYGDSALGELGINHRRTFRLMQIQFGGKIGGEKMEFFYNLAIENARKNPSGDDEITRTTSEFRGLVHGYLNNKKTLGLN